MPGLLLDPPVQSPSVDLVHRCLERADLLVEVGVPAAPIAFRRGSTSYGETRCRGKLRMVLWEWPRVMPDQVASKRLRGEKGKGINDVFTVVVIIGEIFASDCANSRQLRLAEREGFEPSLQR